MKKLLLIALLLSGGVANSATTDQITKALAKYCVPKPSEYPYERSKTTCNSVLEGIFTGKEEEGGTFCTCYDKDYLVYDASLRRCKPKCPKGHFVKTVTACNKGSRKFPITRN